MTLTSKRLYKSGISANRMNKHTPSCKITTRTNTSEEIRTQAIISRNQNTKCHIYWQTYPRLTLIKFTWFQNSTQHNRWKALISMQCISPLQFISMSLRQVETFNCVLSVSINKRGKYIEENMKNKILIIALNTFNYPSTNHLPQNFFLEKRRL